MEVRSLLFLLLLIFLASCSCTQQSEKKATAAKKSSGTAAPEKKKPAKVIYLTGEIISINQKTNKLIIRGRDGDFEVFTDKQTIIKTGSDNSKLSNIASGDKVTVRYISIQGKHIAKSIFIAQEAAQENEIRNSGNVPAEAQKVMPTEQPSSPSEKARPSS